MNQRFTPKPEEPRNVLLDHPIFTTARSRPLNKAEVEVYLSVKAQIQAANAPVQPTPKKN